MSVHAHCPASQCVGAVPRGDRRSGIQNLLSLALAGHQNNDVAVAADRHSREPSFLPTFTKRTNGGTDRRTSPVRYTIQFNFSIALNSEISRRCRLLPAALQLQQQQQQRRRQNQNNIYKQTLLSFCIKNCIAATVLRKTCQLNASPQSVSHTQIHLPSFSLILVPEPEN